ncbi:MAG TPA: imidazolonepropionase [Vicinamibacterales bacterium]|jgi:imidazolonepropionase|nr:imidazolonepropionase [Vicinamibacterales bacterium]
MPTAEGPGTDGADDLIVRNVRVLTPIGPAPLRGAQQGRVHTVENAIVVSRDGRITFVGRSEDEPGSSHGADVVEIDGAGGTLVPGFVDAHTHVVFAGDRRAELRRRLSGATYAEIAAAGGGILATVAATRAASEADLARQTCSRLDEMLGCGTTTAEVKSGYGLDTASELKMLRTVRALDRDHPIDLVPTFLGAHEIPPEHRSRRGDYVKLIIEEMIPAVAAENLAEWCDVFCETDVFTPDESRAILTAGQRARLKARVHADELAASGGSTVAAEVQARSADHLIFTPPAAMTVMAGAGVVATLLPCAAFYLKLGRFAPARGFIDAGVPVALATDVNPGGGFSPSMPFAMALACFSMGLTFEEALVAATMNAAYSLDRHESVGSLEPGKLMDAVLVDGEAINLIRVGAPAIRAVIKRGKVVRSGPHGKPNSA